MSSQHYEQGAGSQLGAAHSMGWDSSQEVESFILQSHLRKV